MKIDSIHAVAAVRKQLPPEQQKEIFAIRNGLPDSANVADTATFWNWLKNGRGIDRPLAAAAKDTIEANKNSSEKFMEEIGAALKQGADHVQKVIDEWKKKVPPNPSIVS